MKNKSLTLNKVFEQIFDFQILLPDFQRDFVWDRPKQSLLLASLLNEIPMGAFLTSKSSSDFNCRMIGMNKYKVSTPQNELLLDGQQRITTLFNVFNDIYGFYQQVFNISPIDVFDKYIFTELKSRWFLNIDSEFVGLNYFKINQNLDTSQVDQSIIYKKDLKTNLNGYGPELEMSKLFSFCKQNKYVPLFLLVSDFRFIIKVLGDLAQNHGSDIQIKFDDQQLEHLRKNHCQNMPFDEFKNAIKNGNDLITEIKNLWLSEVVSFLKELLKAEQSFIHLEDTRKVAESFNYLNRGGVKLSNFDLFCSRFSTLGLRKKTIDLASSFTFGMAQNNLVKLFGIDDSNILNKNNELENTFSEYLVTIYSLYHYHINKPNENDFEMSVIKSNYALDLIPLSFISNQTIEICTNILCEIAVFITVNLGFSGLNVLPNKLAIIPLAWVSIKRDLDFNNNTHIHLLKTHYYTTVFCYYYDSHQNENCVKASSEIIKLFDRCASTQELYLNKIGTDIFSKYLTKEVLLMQTDDYISSSLEINLLNFHLCLNPGGIVDFKLPRQQIDFNSEREIHHLIPLNNATKIKQSTSAIRKDKTHRLNSVLNKSIISKDANRDISGMNISSYMTQISSLFSAIKVGHNIPDSFRSFVITGPVDGSYNPQNPMHLELDRIYTERYNDFKSRIEHYLQECIINF